MNKKYQVLFVALCFPVLLLAISCTPSESVKGGETHNHEEEVYTCPMHPEIRQNKPGTCPICHMKLVKVEKQTLHPQKVILGPKVDEHYIVREGLSEDTEISSGPNFLIDSESKIRGLNDQKHH